MITEQQPADRLWHSMEAAEAIELLQTDPKRGLDPDEADRRLESYGQNVIEAEHRRGKLSLFLSQFSNVLIWVLLVAAGISGIVLSEWIDTFVILAIVVLNAILGYWQESRAEDALARLKEMAAPEAKVVRDGQEVRIPSADVVPGDVVLLETGDRVPADARLIDLVHLETDESALTGESLPVTKSVAPVVGDVQLGDQKDVVFAGTVVSTGRARAAAVRTGRATEMGKLAAYLEAEDPPTPLQIELDRVGKRIALLAFAIALVIFLLGIVREQPVELMFLTAVALAVAAIPEGLPAVVTITLSRGVSAMARDNAIVRRLPAVEALGAASVICTDKTGTLTRNVIRVQELAFADMRTTVDEVSSGDGRVRRYAQIASLCNDARATEDGIVGDPTEAALIRSVDPVLVHTDRLRADHPRVDELSFDSQRKRMSTLTRWGDGYLMAVKGAPEVVIGLSSRMEGPSGPAPLSKERAGRALLEASEFAAQGLRTLAFAYRELDEQPEDLAEAEEELILVAIAAMSDEARPEALPAVREAHQAGIEVVMVTGDHQVTAEVIAAELEIEREGERAMGGAELRAIETEELARDVRSYTVYARVDPTDKVKIVRAWQSQRDIVAMTGDGVNDAPALKIADIGVAMGSGTDVAKDASDMVLADDNFATILAAVREGRGIFANLRKVVYFLLSANVSEVMVMFAGFLLFGSFGPLLIATQLLWINLVTDGLPAIALGMDSSPPGLMTRPPDRQRDILGPPHQARLLWQGSLLALGVLGAFAFSDYVRELSPLHVQTVTFTALVVTQLTHVYNVRAQGTSVIWTGLGDNRFLHLGVIASLLLQIAVIYLPLGNTLFNTVALDPLDWVVIALAALVPFLLIDAIKRWGIRRHPERVWISD
ncbi:MAG: cation-translocating P-type ATPase [Acidimicrobiia bacterium]